jgi:hypothetical protein
MVLIALLPPLFLFFSGLYPTEWALCIGGNCHLATASELALVFLVGAMQPSL